MEVFLDIRIFWLLDVAGAMTLVQYWRGRWRCQAESKSTSALPSSRSRKEAQRGTAGALEPCRGFAESQGTARYENKPSECWTLLVVAGQWCLEGGWLDGGWG